MFTFAGFSWPNLPNLLLQIVETVCNIWFTIEIVIRFLTCPNKVAYFKAPVNIIDLVATSTFYVDLFLTTYGANADLEFFSIIRIMRLFKLTQHSSGLKILMHTIRYKRSKNFACLCE
jgi:potassium voltage-gated channel Shaw-related subfamily C protein